MRTILLLDSFRCFVPALEAKAEADAAYRAFLENFSAYAQSSPMDILKYTAMLCMISIVVFAVPVSILTT
jgi:hypothetical protein